MSAQAVLSMIAPALPSVPQGIAEGDVASGFESLLAGMMGAVVEAEGDEAVPAPVEAGKDDAAAAAVMTGFLLAPAATAVQAAPATGDAAATDAEATDGEAPSPRVAGEAPPTDPDPAPAPKADTPGQPGAADTPGQSTAADKIVLAAKTDPATAPTAPIDAEVLVALGGIARDTAQVAKADVATPPATPPVPAQASVAPPPLRPLAERTSKPLEAAETKGVAAPEAASSASPGVATAPAGRAASNDQPVKAVEAAPSVGPDPTAAAGDDAPEQAPLQADAGAPTTQAAPTAREIHVSTLSRATVEATAQIAAQILKKLDGRSTRFEMALTPDELGRVDVKLDIDSEGRLAARLAFDNPAAATDLKGRADELRRQLEQAGFQMADDAFEFAERDSGSSAFDRGRDDRGQGRAFAAASRLNAEADSLAPPPRWTALTLSPSGVDMKV